MINKIPSIDAFLHRERGREIKLLAATTPFTNAVARPGRDLSDLPPARSRVDVDNPEFLPDLTGQRPLLAHNSQRYELVHEAL
jgi:hypothetical protein